MGKKYFFITLLILSVYFFHMPNIYARSSRVGTTSANFIKIKGSSRVEAMAGAFGSISDDVNAVNYNPAGLYQLKYSQITTSYNKWFQGIHNGYIAYAQTINKISAFGASFQHTYVGGLGHTTWERNNPITGDLGPYNEIEMFSFLNFMLTGSYSHRIRNDLILGGSLKITRELLAPGKTYQAGNIGFLFDIGGFYLIPVEKLNISDIYKLFIPKKLGFCFSNLGYTTPYEKEADLPPMNFNLGLSYDIVFTSKQKLLIGIDFNAPIDYYINSKLGLEYRYYNPFGQKISLYARTGFKTDSDLGWKSRFTFGLGMKWRKYSFDYAFVPYIGLGMTHRVSLSLGWGYYEEGSEDEVVTIFDFIEEAKEKEELDMVIETNDKVEALIRKADLLAQQQKYEKSIAAYQEALKIAPAIKDIHQKLGLVYGLTGEIGKSSDEFINASKPNTIEELVTTGNTYASQKMPDKALYYYRQAEELNPNDETVKQKIKETKEKIDTEHKKDEVIKPEEASVLKQDDAQTEEETKETVETTGKTKTEEEKTVKTEVTEKIVEKPKIVKKSFEEFSGLKAKNEGDKLLEENKIDEAIAAYEKAIQLFPANKEIYGLLGPLYGQRADITKASEAFTKSAEEPTAQDYITTGDNLTNEGIFDKAVEFYNKALSIQPDNTDLKLRIEAAKKGKPFKSTKK